MYEPVDVAPLSKASIHKLLKGLAVRIKHGHGLKLHLSKVQHKKHHSAKLKGKGYNLTFDPYQMEMHKHLKGKGFFEDIGNAFQTHLIQPAQEGFQNSIVAPTQELGHQIEHVGKKVGRKVASKLIHEGIPMAGSTLGGLAGSYTGNPLLGMAGSELGGVAGHELAQYVGDKTGLGLHSILGKIVPHAKKAMIHVGKELAKGLITKGLHHAEQMALKHGVPEHLIHHSKHLAHRVAMGEPIEHSQAVAEMSGALQHHPHYAKVQEKMKAMFGHGIKHKPMKHKMHTVKKMHTKKRMSGGTALIDQPFTVRQGTDAISRFGSNPLGTIGYGMKHKGGSLYPAGY